MVREKAVSLRHHLFFFDLLSFMKTHPKLNVSYSIKELKDTDRACEYNNCEKKSGRRNSSESPWIPDLEKQITCY